MDRMSIKALCKQAPMGKVRSFHQQPNCWYPSSNDQERKSGAFRPAPALIIAFTLVVSAGR